MTYTCSCPNCSRQVSVPDNLRGREVRCPQCRQIFVPSFDLDAAPTVAASGNDAGEAPLAYQEAHAHEQRPPEYRPPLEGQGYGTVAICLLLANSALYLLDIPIQFMYLRFFDQVQNGRVDRVQGDLLDALTRLIGCGGGIFYLASAVFVCVWLYKTYDNLSLLDCRGREFSPGWAVGYFFIPILNLYRPYQVVQEIFKASDPKFHDEDSVAWRLAPGSALVGFWWFFWIIGNIISNISARQSLQANRNLPELRIGAFIDIASSALMLMAAVLLIGVISSIRSRQKEKWAVVAGMNVSPSYE